MLVSSQKISSRIRLLDSEMPSMAAMNSINQQQVQLAEGVFRIKVIIGVDINEGADAGDQQGKQQAKRIKAEAQVNAELRQPWPALRNGLAVEDIFRLSQQQNQAA